MFDGILSPAFLQAACAKAQSKVNVIMLNGVMQDPIINSLTCVGEITIESVKNGEPVTETYSDLTTAQVSIQADADSDVVIKGDVTVVEIGEQAEGYIKDLVCAKQYVLRTNALTHIGYISGTAADGDTSSVEDIDASGCENLEYIACPGCTEMTVLNLTGCSHLEDLICGNCSSLTELDLSACPGIQGVACVGCTALVSILYNASTDDVTTYLADAITAATADNGVLHTDSEGAYYQTLADAATAKGWTIEQL